MGAFRLHTFWSRHIEVQPTARNGARSVDARERRRRNGFERRQAQRARTRGTRRVGLFGAPRWRTQSVSRKFPPRTMSISHLSEGRKLHGLHVKLNILNALLCFSMWQRDCTQRSRHGGDEQCSLSLSRQPNAALNLTVCPPRGRLVACGVDARVTHEQKCRQPRFETTKPQRNISRTLNANSFMQQDERKTSRTRSPRGKSPSGRMSRWLCKDCLKGTCTNSFCEKWHPPECLFYKTKSGCRFGEKCSYAHRQVDEQPSKRSKKNDDKSAVVMLKKYEFHDRTGQPVVGRDTRHE